MTCTQLQLAVTQFFATRQAAATAYLTGAYPMTLPIGTNGTSIGDNLYCDCNNYPFKKTFKFICLSDPMGICPPCGNCPEL